MASIFGRVSLVAPVSVCPFWRRDVGGSSNPPLVYIWNQGVWCFGCVCVVYPEEQGDRAGLVSCGKRGGRVALAWHLLDYARVCTLRVRFPFRGPFIYLTFPSHPPPLPFPSTSFSFHFFSFFPSFFHFLFPPLPISFDSLFSIPFHPYADLVLKSEVWEQGWPRKRFVRGVAVWGFGVRTWRCQKIYRKI